MMVGEIMIKTISLDYSKNFEYGEDVAIIYTEKIGKDKKTSICAKSIIKWIEILISKFENGYKIYSIDKQNEVSFEELIKIDFLFYSYKNGLKYREFFITSDDIEIQKYKNINECFADNIKGVVIANDYDGDGLNFITDDSFLRYNWIIEYLKSYSVDIYEYKKERKEVKLSIFNRIIMIILVALVTPIAVIIIIFRDPFSLITMFKKRKS
jgi:hypothetical protein